MLCFISGFIAGVVLMIIIGIVGSVITQYMIYKRWKNAKKGRRKGKK